MSCWSKHEVVGGALFYGTSRYGFDGGQLALLPPSRGSLDAWICAVEDAVSRLSGGHQLRVDSVRVDEFDARFAGNGFEVRYEARKEDV